MRLLQAYKILAQLSPAFSTRDAATVLGLSAQHTSVILSRLTEEKMIIRLAQGRFAYADALDPLLLPAILTYPVMSYVSLYTALYFHGLIEQIPDLIYAVSLTRTKMFQTPLATVSIHQINSLLFTDYQAYGEHDILMATPEKALFDTLYFSPAKSLRFASLTELELPPHFDKSLFKHWLGLIQHKGRKSLITRKLQEYELL